MLSLLLATALDSTFNKPDDPNAVNMWIHDLGRLTPFGRTFDVYIQSGFDPDFSYPNGEPRRPYRIGSTYGNESPSRSFGWSIEGDIFKNHRPDHLYPWLENCQECIDYWNQDTGILCPEAGEYWECIQANPYQRWMYLGMNFTPINWVFEGPEGCCPRTADHVDLEYAWCDSWILHGELGKKYGNQNQYRWPLVQQQHKDLITPHPTLNRVLKFWPPYEDIQSERCCSSPSQLDIGDLIKWDPDVDWESEKWPGSFHIARFTGPDYFASGGVVRWACGNGHPCEPSYYSVNYYVDNSCPSDLNEDGLVGFEDLLQVLSDVAGVKYHPQTNNGFNAILKVLSEWGTCE